MGEPPSLPAVPAGFTTPPVPPAGVRATGKDAFKADSQFYSHWLSLELFRKDSLRFRTTSYPRLALPLIGGVAQQGSPKRSDEELRV